MYINFLFTRNDFVISLDILRHILFHKTVYRKDQAILGLVNTLVGLTNASCSLLMLESQTQNLLEYPQVILSGLPFRSKSQITYIAINTFL